MASLVKVGFIGAGGIAKAHADALTRVPDVQIAAVTDASPQAAQEMAEKTGAKVFPSASALARDSGVQALFILLPPFAHGEAEKAALESKLPFFIEKPVGLDVSFLQEMAAEIEKNNLMTCAGYMNRYRKSVNTARDLLQKEPPVLAFGGWWGGTPGNHPWWIEKDKSGGQFHEQVTHTVDIARYLMGEPEEVYCAAAHGFNKGIPRYTMDDAATVVIRFKAGGIANLMSSVTSNAGGRVFLDLNSLNRNFHFTDWEHNLVITEKGGEKQEIKGEPDIFAVEDAVFVQAVRSGDRSHIRSSYADAVKSAALSLAANVSLETGRPVSVA